MSGVMTGKRSPAEVRDFIMKMGDEAKMASNMTDEELAEAVTKRVWGDIEMDSEESAIVSEIVERFRKAKGLSQE